MDRQQDFMAAGVAPMSPARLVILGTEHSPELVAESYQLAAYWDEFVVQMR